MTLFFQKKDKATKVKFLRDIWSALRDSSQSEEEKTEILTGALLYTGLTAKEVQEEIDRECSNTKVC